nr:hypothetical transcript [Hymenolepis microstoma]
MLGTHMFAAYNGTVNNVSAPLADIGDGPDPSQPRKVFIGGIPHDATEIELIQLFGEFGEIRNCEMKCNPSTHQCRDVMAADRACRKKYLLLRGKRLEVKWALSRNRMSATLQHHQQQAALPIAQTAPYLNTEPVVYNATTLMPDFSQLPYAGLNPAQLIQNFNGNTQIGYYNQVLMLPPPSVPPPPPPQLPPFVQYGAQLAQLNSTAAALLQQFQAQQTVHIPIPTVHTSLPTNTTTQ